MFRLRKARRSQPEVEVQLQLRLKSFDNTITKESKMSMRHRLLYHVLESEVPPSGVSSTDRIIEVRDTNFRVNPKVLQYHSGYFRELFATPHKVSLINTQSFNSNLRFVACGHQRDQGQRSRSEALPADDTLLLHQRL